VLTKDLKMLKKNLREFLYPFTAKNFNESPNMKLKEILTYTNNYNIKNLMFLTAKEKGNYLKMMSAPDGPTFTFKINSYCV